MATSSKVMFNLETLQKQALESIDKRINAARLEVDSYDDEAALVERIVAWRKLQETRVADLYAKLPEISDVMLAKFRVQEMPDNSDKYERQRANARLRDLEALRSRIVAKSESLVADENGSIALTKTQLQEFFGL